MKKETDILLDKISEVKDLMDEKCHDLFLNKEILAPVLKETIEEYEGLSLDEIIDLIDEASISKVEAVSDYPKTDDVRVTQIDTDLKSVSDKNVLFDVHFKAALPENKRTELNIQLFIDFEAQGSYSPGYPLIKRSIYYSARSLSRQLGELTKETNYGVLQKVYSIWVCYDSRIPKKFKNTVSRYKLTKEDFYGTVEEEITNYDLLEVVLIRLDTDADSSVEIFDYLKGVLTNNRDKIISRIGTPQENINKEVDTVQGIGDLIWDKAWNEAWGEAKVSERTNVISTMLKKGKTPEEISELFDYSMEEIRAVQEKMLVKN